MTKIDHISSRFRRPKKTTGTTTSTSLAPSPGSSSPDVTKLAPAPPTTQHESPPVLSITTTTPPGSSHSTLSSISNQSDQNSNTTNGARNVLHPPKSPLRSFHPFRSNKRARSPAPASLAIQTSPAVVNHNGIVEHEMTSPSKDQPQNGDGTAMDKPKIPAFLALSEQEIEAGFQDITWRERIRLQQAAQNPSPSFQFARILPPEAKMLDRYANIQPWANNRVKLQVPEGELDYVNASPIVLHSPLNPEKRPPHRYIAMQGPKMGTMDHVWRMVAEQLSSPAVIVMLTETHEMGMEKCYPYFPRTPEEEPLQIGEDNEFGDDFRAQVKCANVEERADGAIELRKITIDVEGSEESMVVWHLLYRRWPDFGVPALEDIDSFFELMRLSREKNASDDNPRIIHCSAGVGRSGTFMALEHLMRELDSGDLENYDQNHSEDLVFDTVNALREQRRQMVQAESQYLFIYTVLRKLWMEKYGVVEEQGEEPAAKRIDQTTNGASHQLPQPTAEISQGGSDTRIDDEEEDLIDLGD
ncbi:hypothetical protein DL770_009767 [Monosporascus sp. CRB-9-2]|nr:hypothetical protein DL770_009767 [Monosporascus sp. CRB-9-2]